jgi:hypothetical protein
MASKEILGWFKFPEPDGTSLFQEEFTDKDKLLELFTYCQQGLGFVKDKGWKFLIEELGIEGVMELDAQSGWLKDADKGAWLSNIFYQVFTSGYDPQAGEFGEYDIETKQFIYNDNTGRKIDWQEISDFSKQL